MKIAVVGATGEVGRTMIKVLQERDVRPKEIDFYASARSAGTKVEFRGASHEVKELDKRAMGLGYDYLLFSAGGAVSREYAPLASEAGTVVIDNSSAFRMDPAVPLVVPEINSDLLKGYERGIIANPNCSTIQMVLALHLVHERFGIKTIVVSTYQAVSGAGKSGIDELNDQMEGKISPKKFIRQIHLNVVPQIGALLDSGFTDEEMKLVDETRRILRDPEISIWPTAIRVPVYYGHSESIFVETRTSFDMSSLAEALDESETVRHTDDMVSPIEIAGSDESHVCRLRSFDDRRFLIWNVADNIRTGAATNAVRILMKHRELNRAG
ncbi:MAG: aspartate-semialdehyde dehydrogenase [Synergistaceae bacterium]|nr:aspartate-semialdehyde dehydrogenase [Synergistaceae bacterium]